MDPSLWEEYLSLCAERSMFHVVLLSIQSFVVVFVRRWREVLTSCAPGHMAQMQALVKKFPEVAMVTQSLSSTL